MPIIKTLRESLVGNHVHAMTGILNGTCNYILTRMQSEGHDFAEVLKDAQALGYAEADPTFDVGGFDTAHKLSLLTTLAFGTQVAFDQVHVEGIEGITPADIEAADGLGYRIKLLGVAMKTDSGIEQRVHPAMVAKASAIAQVSGVTNGVAIDGDFGPQTLEVVSRFQADAGLEPDGKFGRLSKLALAAAYAAVAPPDPALTSTLRFGSRGTEVAVLQQVLGREGFSPGPSDGIFGPMTQRAVIDFQTARALIVDGVVGPQTRRALQPQ